MASVKVAVRVRPFNQREIDMGAKLILQMDGKKTRITNYLNKNTDRQTDQYKYFTFDYSYWSFDDRDHHYISQEQVFSDLGTEVVDAAFEGYNACVFAYGQTGSGKTFTMMGSKDNQGLIPRICESLFKRMAQGAKYRIEVSYLEIYNEKVKDLLRKDSGHNLKVRQHPTRGPCVMDLSRHLVSEYCHIQELMERGNNQRTTASTNMNDVSSRSHAIFTLMFVQAQGDFYSDIPSETVSKVHLVDLAGSERADATGATGQRLKEGAHINKSLVTLGSVISALAELSANSGRKTSGFIPYRDSVLTWLLKDSLGGNSKTIMIAAISPADCNYSETLSTLRYANRAKNIINKPTINEDENVKLIRDLREEITKLKSMLSGDEYTTDVQPKVLAVLQEKEAQEKVLREEWTEKWRETQKILKEQKALGLRKAGDGAGVVLDSDMPHLIGIDDDLLSTGVTLYHLNDGETLIGSSEADDRQDIVLNGVDVEKQHCSIVLEKGLATLIPRQNALCWVNGLQVNKPTRLSQGCNILLGRTNMFRYNDPVEVEKLRKEGSRSLLNLSRLSLMSWSTPDLCRDTVENIDLSVGNDDSILARQKNDYLIQESMCTEEDFAENEESESHSAQQTQPIMSIESYNDQCRQLATDKLKLVQMHEERTTQLQVKEEELSRRKSHLQSQRETQVAFILDELKRIAEMQANLDMKREELDRMSSQKNEALQYYGNNNGNTFSVDPQAAESLRKAIINLECEVRNRNTALEREKATLQAVETELKEATGTLEPVILITEEPEKNRRKLNLNLSITSRYGPVATSSPNISINQFNRDLEEQESPVTDSQRTSSGYPRFVFSQVMGEGDSEADALYLMKQLTQQIGNQRQLIMRYLESEINSDDLNRQIAVLQDMKREYVKLEQRLQDQDDSSSKENVKININAGLNSTCSQETCDSDELSTSADDTISESMTDNRKFRSRGCLNCAVLSKSSQDIRYRILQDRLQMSLVPSLSVSSQDMDQLPITNYNLTRSMPSLHRISVWDGRIGGDPDWDGRIAISVPKYLIRGAGRNTHFVYEILICVEGETYSVLRRYRRFRELHLTMKLKFGDPVAKLSFPPRKLFIWKTDGESLAKERRPQLETYLKRLISTCSTLSSCPLNNCSTKTALHQFSPFFKRGMFETGKYGTS